MSVLKQALVAGAAALMAVSGMAMSSLAGAAPLDPGYRELNADTTLVIDTTKGRIVVEMTRELAPAHVDRMLTLTRRGFYDGLIFHRVMADFMAQTGDPQGTGQGGSDLPNLKAEFSFRRDASLPLVVAEQPAGSLGGFVGASPVRSQVNEIMAITNDGKANIWGVFCQGTLGMARDSSPDSANSQFFLMRAPNTFLETRYTAFGTVVSGLDVVRKLKLGEPPVDPDKMLKVQVLADMPPSERPQLAIMDTKSPQFQQVIETTRKEKAEGFTLCDVEVPVKDLAAPAPAPAVAAAQ